MNCLEINFKMIYGNDFEFLNDQKPLSVLSEVEASQQKTINLQPSTIGSPGKNWYDICKIYCKPE